MKEWRIWNDRKCRFPGNYKDEKVRFETFVWQTHNILVKTSDHVQKGGFVEKWSRSNQAEWLVALATKKEYL